MRRLRKILTVLLIAVVVSSTSSVAWADNRTAKDYMAEGIRAAYDNMHLVYQGYYDENGELEEQSGGYVAIWQEWDENGNLLSKTYLEKNCQPVNRTDGYARVVWTQDDNGIWKSTFFNDQGETIEVEFIDVDGDVAPPEGLNLVSGFNPGEDGWSEWMTPINDNNCCFNIGEAVLGMKHAGDKYRCRVKIEFRDVIASDSGEFWFRSQGAVDGVWEVYNPWNNYVNLREVPKDGLYDYEYVYTINTSIANAREFNIAFRCDYWESGSFRVRDVIFEKCEQ